MNSRQKYIFNFLVLAFVLIVPQFAVAQTAIVCTNLTSDVSSGMTDTTVNGEVLQLQTFLEKSGYLSAAPNGHFGPATLAAVELFQSINGISTTGYVGPLTRTLIENKTCAVTINTTAPIVSSSGIPTSASIPSAPTPVSQSFAITSPSTNQTLTIGSNQTISWNSNSGYNYSIILQTQNGVGSGIIASSLSAGNQYVWQVGQIISPDGTGYKTIVPGTYQIHIETGSGQDLYSGPFTVTAPSLAINSIEPSSVPADGKTAVVLFGSGFINPTNVYINGSYTASVLFTSSDGKVIVFSVPTNILAGQQTVYASNQYGSYSNGVILNVTTPSVN